MNLKPPVPSDEFERVLNLADFNFDNNTLNSHFSDLTRLAAKIAGTQVSLINLIDSFTQWTVSSHGLDITQMAREDSVCQYTIMEDSNFEVRDLTVDERFKEKFYVKDDPSLRYYYGIPLKLGNSRVGALCMLDQDLKTMTREKVDLLEIVAKEVVNRLETIRQVEELKAQVQETKAIQNKVIHDIRGPIGGIIGLTQIIHDQGMDNTMEEVLEFVTLIHKSGKSVLDLADEILTSEYKHVDDLLDDQFTLDVFCESLERLFLPQARSKQINFKVLTSSVTSSIAISRNKLLQIAGNLVSNAIKFTPEKGDVTVKLSLTVGAPKSMLVIEVSDSGEGLNQLEIEGILSGYNPSKKGTSGEYGYGYGLNLVQHLVEGLGGSLNIYTNQGGGATFKVTLTPLIS